MLVAIGLRVEAGAWVDILVPKCQEGVPSDGTACLVAAPTLTFGGGMRSAAWMYQNGSDTWDWISLGGAWVAWRGLRQSASRMRAGRDPPRFALLGFACPAHGPSQAHAPSPRALHDEPERWELAGAVAQQRLLVRQPRRRPVKLFLRFAASGRDSGRASGGLVVWCGMADWLRAAKLLGLYAASACNMREHR